MSNLRTHPNPELTRWSFGEGVPASTHRFRAWRTLLRGTMQLLWDIRVYNRHYEPTRGSAVYICNHQSFFDPILMSYALYRPMNYMARDSLFRNPGFRRLIASVNAFPVRRGKADTGALKEAIRRLRAGGQLVMFAEGTRTTDGKIGEFLPGVAMLAQRAAEWIVPVVIDGAYEAWPRDHILPSRGKIIVQYAPPIPSKQVRKMPSGDFVNELRRQLIEMQTDVRRRVGRPELNYDD